MSWVNLCEWVPNKIILVNSKLPKIGTNWYYHPNYLEFSSKYEVEFERNKIKETKACNHTEDGELTTSLSIQLMCLSWFFWKKIWRKLFKKNILSHLRISCRSQRIVLLHCGSRRGLWSVRRIASLCCDGIRKRDPRIDSTGSSTKSEILPTRFEM